MGQDDCLHDVLRKQNVQATDANVIMLLKYNSNVLEYGQLIPGMELTIPAVWNKEQIKYTGTNYVPICIGCYQVENHEGLLGALRDHMGDTYFNLFIANHFDSQQPRSYPCVVRIARSERLSLLGIINPEDVVKGLLCTIGNFKGLDYHPIIALVCYEKPSEFCHRHLVSDWLNAAGFECEEFKKIKNKEE